MEQGVPAQADAPTTRNPGIVLGYDGKMLSVGCQAVSLGIARDMVVGMAGFGEFGLGQVDDVKMDMIGIQTIPGRVQFVCQQSLVECSERFR